MHLTFLLLIGLFLQLLGGNIDTNGIERNAGSILGESPDSSAGSGSDNSGVTFRLVDEQIKDTPVKTQVEQHVVVVGDATEAALRAELKRRFDAAKRRSGWRHHDRTTNVYIYIYGTEEQATAGQGLWLGMVAWTSHGGATSARYQIHQGRLANLGTSEEKRFGLTEQERKTFLRELVAAEKRATNEAMRRIPDSRLNEQLDLEAELMQRYRNEVFDKWGVTEEQAGKIATEAWEKGWST